MARTREAVTTHLRRRVSFAVPVTAAQYAPEELICSRDNRAIGGIMEVTELSTLVEALTATAQVEVWVLKAGGVPETAGDWVYSGTAYTTLVLQAALAMAPWVGVKLRVKSGGTAGTTIVSAAWW